MTRFGQKLNYLINTFLKHTPDPSSIREVIKHILSFLTHELQHDKTNKVTSVRPAKTRISLGIRPI